MHQAGNTEPEKRTRKVQGDKWEQEDDDEDGDKADNEVANHDLVGFLLTYLLKTIWKLRKTIRHQ